jgi:hypothetical protein
LQIEPFYGTICKQYQNSINEGRTMKKFTDRPDLPGWIDMKQSRGIYFFTRDEALEELKFSSMAFRKAALRLAGKNRVLRIHVTGSICGQACMGQKYSPSQC